MTNLSIEINKKRFKMSDQLTQVFLNTVNLLEDPFAEYSTQKDI